METTPETNYPVVKCLDCPATFTQLTNGPGARVRCPSCQVAAVKERNRLRNREARRNIINRCQICRVNGPKHIAPDGTGVKCCDGCYEDCLAILASERRRKASVRP